jgi:hypothetical protein
MKRVKNLKKFNTMAICLPELHYMVDISEKLIKIKKLIDDGAYFTINKARQYGKTTTLFALEKYIKDKYNVISISFEGIDDSRYENRKRFIEAIFMRFKEVSDFYNYTWLSDCLEKYSGIDSLDEMSIMIKDINTLSDKPIVLIIDEVDKSIDNQLFLNFLGMIRNMFLDRIKRGKKTFYSVILSGVHDVKNLKLKIRADDEQRYNSPWNIATEFDIEMKFNEFEISTMLKDYKLENSIEFDIDIISRKIYEFTNGYPFLVSKICSIIDEKLNKNWSENGINEAVKLLIKENNTLFDSVIKNIENNKDFKNFIYDILIEGIEFSYVHTDGVISLGTIYNILKEENGKVKIDNKIFEILIYNHFSILKERTDKKLKRIINTKYLLKNNDLDIVNVLKSFQSLMKNEYRKEDKEFIEREGRLLFLAFLKPIINGNGFYFVEPQSRNNTRMDIVITYNLKQYIIELKIWRGKKLESSALKQLSGYLKSRNENEGYLLIFNFNKDKEYTSDWKEKDGKRIYEVIV